MEEELDVWISYAMALKEIFIGQDVKLGELIIDKVVQRNHELN